ncbi:T9SS type A sorting domain-containing protein [candidate division WOR-3 bacterium]|nr:T9SS type A sorting domain-containing protein [candidate division WOR-3 bacterium]
MKKYLQRFICPLCIFVLVAPLFLHSDPVTAYDHATLQEVINMNVDCLADAKALRQHAVLWDTTHGTYLNYSPFTRYSTLTSMLIDSGYTIDLCATGVHTVDLSQYDMILVSVMNSWNSPYSQEEVDSLISYYNQGRQRVLLTGDGNFCENTYIPYAANIQFSYNVFDWISANGGIFIMGDNAGCMNGNINPVANAFYMTAGVSTISPSDLYFSNFAPHPVFNNVSQIYYRAAGSISTTTPAEAIAWTDALEPVIGLLDESVGIKEEQGRIVHVKTMRIDPNPFKSCANISGVPGTACIHVYDASGRLVQRVTGTVFGRNLKQGVYFLGLEGYAPKKVIKIR